MPLRLSVLDYSPVDESCTASEALLASTALAGAAENLGYERFWVSEHHHSDALAGVSPELLMMHLAGATSRIRIGSGGVMLPHYNTLKVAENFQLIEALHPGRTDLGFGRAPGADRAILEALNEEKGMPMSYEDKVRDLKSFLTGGFSEGHRHAGLRARPRTSTSPEMWLLGASGNTATLAAQEGVGFTFAHFINPTMRGPRAAGVYRETFIPSALHSTAEVLVAVFVAVADTAQQAQDLAGAFHLWLAQTENGQTMTALPSIESTKRHRPSGNELAAISRNGPRLLAGTASQVINQLQDLAALYDTDQVMVNPNIPGIDHRIRSLELLAHANRY